MYMYLQMDRETGHLAGVRVGGTLGESMKFGKQNISARESGSRGKQEVTFRMT